MTGNIRKRDIGEKAMNWNHRVVRVMDCIDEQGTAHYKLILAEVYYNDDGTPSGYSECFMHGDELGDLRQLVNRLGDALNKDIVEFPATKDTARMSVPGGWLPGDECPLCGDAETCKECK